ncbi:MAG: sensor domain-containing diguanylate cyclase [Candidatus Omnitrophica bacterium]|nr:sensor domain-containing diguanylate cyclase [Candidatus Omnitrophota bacterium]MDD5436031.1 sensor domain-containing diguanylate cyclase [Candidatus Omnitrophota bacterium]
MEKIEKEKALKDEIERLNWEFSLLYEISNAIRTTLKLDQILYIILTALTSHEGLGFNRAMLFLVNEKENVLEGVMGIGPHTAEEAGKIWHYITESKMSLDDFIASYDTFKRDPESKLNSIVKGIKIPLREDMGILVLTILEGMPFEITTQEAKKLVDPNIQKTLNTDFFVTVPLKAKDKVLGAILVDNIFNKNPITKSDVKMLTMFANHAGLAIENSRLYEETVYLSSIDWSTKLWNYGKFQQRLSYELERSKITDTRVSLVMVDVDNFKHYNDTLGHIRGDNALREIAGVLQSKSRKVDTVARYGGEEFVVVMPNTNKENARLFAERLRSEVEKLFFEESTLPAANRLTISCGVACYPDDTIKKDDLIAKADMALYEAKGAGKNRTCVYSKAMGDKRSA